MKLKCVPTTHARLRVGWKCCRCRSHNVKRDKCRICEHERCDTADVSEPPG